MAMTLDAYLAEFKGLVLSNSSSNDAAEKKLEEMKKMMLELDSLPPLGMITDNAAAERKFAQETLELAVILSINTENKDSFQRQMTSLRPYYSSIEKSKTEMTMIVLGLNLLFLLVENRLADFHCELELLSEEEQQHPAILFCTQLDQHLVVGSYDQVLTSAANPPSPYYSYFLTSLLETVRENVGECICAAYTTLSVQAATQMLMFNTIDETKAFITENYPTWVVTGDSISLTKEKQVISNEIPSLNLISQNLSYATELERIV